MTEFWNYTGEDEDLQSFAVMLSPDPMRRLMSFLRKRMVHVTSIEGYQGIRRDRAIRPNDGSRPFSFPQSEKSYALKSKAVALFDFAGATDEQMLSQYWGKYSRLLRCHEPATIVLHLCRTELMDSVIRYEQAMAEVGFRAMIIPFVEVCHVGDISAQLIEKVTVVQISPFRFRTLSSGNRKLSDIGKLMSELWPAR